MSRPRIKSKVFDEGSCLGEAVVIPTKNQSFQFPNNEIRITRLSPPSERCHPLSVLLTISPLSVCCKIESGLSQDQPLLNSLHFTCLRDRKTAVVSAGEEDLHLVAMMSKNQNYPCFWCCSVPVGLYEPCLAMLNLRCLAIVFDLDETLIVANTMKSFEDRIEVITRRISDEDDPGRISGMSAELKRYLEDKALLKQYAEGDHVLDNGKLIRAQNEEVLSVSDGRELIVRPVIRLQERNTILTRINPEVRDTSVLVRLRPAWEDLRSYLTAKGRKRFEVYVCTMAERDYALEMWRLLDPESHLISSTQLLNRVVCVKSGLRKSLSNVFQDGNCHPQMAMVIDDRLKVWNDKDQPRVHVVPAFMPYYAPQAETANAVPVLCVARNVACNVRGGFFREFDENLLRKIYELCYEDETQNLPQSPDVSDYLIAEDAFAVPNGNPVPEGMTGAEVERRLHNADEKRGTDSDPPLGMAHSDVNHEAFQQPSSSDVTGVPVCRETVQNLRVPGASAGGKVTQSETGLDTRLSKMEDQNSLNLSQSKTSAQRSVMITQPCGGWLVEDINPDQFTNQGSRINQEFEPLGPEKHQVQNGNSKNSIDSSGLVSIPQVEEAHCGDQRPALLVQSSPPFLDEEGSQNQLFKDSKDIYAEGSVVIFPSVISIGVLLEIGKKCDYKVEFRSIVSTSKDLQSVEVLFTGEKIGIGTGKTLKEANLQAAENALHNLASKYAAFIAPNAQTTGGKLRKFPLRNENGILSDTPIGSDKLSSREPMPDVSRSGLLISPEDSERLSFLVSNIRELCMTEGLRVAFQDQPPASVILNKGEFYHQVEIDGQILGKGIGINKDKAKLQAAEEALQSLKSTVNQQTQKPPNPQRSHAFPNKRLKVDNSRGLHGTSSSRYHKNGQPTS